MLKTKKATNSSAISMIDKSKKIISMLFKSEVRVFNEENLAGCERVFIEDARFLKSINKLGNVYTAAENRVAKNSDFPSVKKIPYPHKLLDYVTLEILKVPIIRRAANKINKTIILVTEFYFALSFIIREFRADYYYVFQTPLVALFFPNKTTVVFHNFYLDLDYIFTILFFFRRKSRGIKFAFVSESLMRQYQDYYPLINNSKCSILRNSVDPNMFRTIQNKNTKITFTFLSAWVPVKGIHLLPKIVEEINKRYMDQVQFIIGGSIDLWSLSKQENKEYKKIENMIQNLSKRYSNVKVVGLIDRSQVAPLLSSSTFCLLPSIWPEPASLLASESLSCGTPVIAFNVGGNKEIISDNKNGYLVDTIGETSYIHKMKEVLNDFHWSEYKKMSENAREAAKKYTPAKRNRDLQKILMG